MDLVLSNSQLPAKLKDALKKYLENEYSANTRETYLRGFRRFASWCEERSLEPLPCQEPTLILYITEMAESHKVSTIENWLYAINRFHLASGHESPLLSHNLKRLRKGIKNTKGVRPRKAKPIKKTEVNDIVTWRTDNETLKGLRDRVIFLWSYTGAFRVSELSAMNLEDITLDERGYTAFVPKSKTDQQGHGKYVAIPYHSRPGLCPVRAMQKYLEAVGISQAPGDTAVFISFRKSDKPIYDSRLQRKNIWDLYKKYAGDFFSTHSSRSGFITDRIRSGDPLMSIALQTGQKLPTIESYYQADSVWDDNNAVYNVRD